MSETLFEIPSISEKSIEENIINLIDDSKGTVKYTISHFPDGQWDIALDTSTINLRYPVRIICRIRNADELFLVRMTAEVLKDMHAHLKWLDIMYLMAARTDRKFDYGRPCTLQLVMKDLESTGAEFIDIIEPHNYEATQRFTTTPIIKSNIGLDYEVSHPCYPSLFQEVRMEGLVSDNIINPMTTILVAPDEGAYIRMKDDPEYNYFTIIHCNKIRNKETGVIEKVDIIDLDQSDISEFTLLVIDDLSDGGGTFLAIAPELRKLNPKCLGIAVTHNIQLKGLKALSNTYDFVATTNSYEDWDKIVAEDKSMTNVLVCELKQLR